MTMTNSTYDQALAETLLLVSIDGDAPVAACAAALIHDNASDPEAMAVIRGVADGTLAEGRIGGGAAPLYVFTLAPKQEEGAAPDEDGDTAPDTRPLLERIEDMQNALHCTSETLRPSDLDTAADCWSAVNEMLHAMREAKQLLEDGGIAGGTLDLINATLAKWEG
jgi:hypothetical protein